MIAKNELKAWLNTLPDDSSVAIDDGGLTLVEIDSSTEETGNYIEIGGTPVEDDEDLEPENDLEQA